MAAGSVRLSRLKRVAIPESLVVGNKFVKWEEDSSAGVPVTLRVDPKGYILYWKEQNKDVGYLDLSLVRDTRTGRQARLPKDGRLRDLMNIGEDCPLEEKLVTVCWGCDFVNVTFVTFAAIGSDIAKEWTDVLFACATSLQTSNSCPLSLLEKCHSILTLVTETEGRTPVRSIVKMFAQNKEERRRVELVLESLGYSTGKDDFVSKFTFDDFFVFYNKLCGRLEVDSVFRLYGDGHHLTAEQFMRFLNKQQRDPRLNEVLYPLCNVTKAHGVIQQFEPASELANRGMLSREGFLKYLLSDDNSVMPREKLDLTQDMSQSLAHYFVNSSHNTYLTGHQLTGRSSVEIYRQVLLTGCRCIELDCWDGKGADEEPIITHGFTVCTEISCREVLEAIADTAFKVSDYPVILSFENHCCQKQQAKLARYCRLVFGEMLLTDAFDSHPLDVNIPLPSPELLKRRILIKNKKRPTQTSESELERRAASVEPEPARRSSCPFIAAGGGTSLQLAAASDVDSQTGSGSTAAVVRPGSGTDRAAAAALLPGNNIIVAATSGPNGGPAIATVSSIASSIGASGGSWGGLENTNVSWEISDGCRSPATPLTGSSGMFDDFDWEPEGGLEESLTNLTVEDLNKRRSVMQEKGTAAQEVEAGKDMSVLVNYIEPVRFHSFEFSEKRNRCYECTSFVETQATVLLKTFPVDFVKFNKRQLSRIYPKGTRVDSSNYMPQIFWNAGCQFVALNFQTLDLPMQLNLGTFEYNGRCGFLLKPDFMRRKDRQFDPFAESPVDGIVAGCVEVKIISGQFISDRKCGTFVEVDMFGLPTDTVRRKWRTRVVPNNAINPVYEADTFVFPKIVLPNLASLRIAVYNDSGTTLLGHRVLPVDGLRPGYRHIGLRNECNQPQGVATLFVYIQVKDFIIDAFAAIAAALSNPIAYQSELEKREKQLSILEDEDIDCKSPVYEDPISPVVNKAISAVHLRSGSLTPVQQVRSNDPSAGGDPSLLMYVARSTSVPGSPYQSSSNLAVGVDSKLDISKTTRLKDAGVVVLTTLSDLKETKTFLKLVAKQSKQLETLRRKHEKVQGAKMMSQQAEIDKLVGSGGRSRTVTGSLGKGNAKRFQFYADIEENDVVSKLRRCHVDELIGLCCEHYRLELDLQLCHQSSVSILLERLAAARRDEQTTKLDKIHAREVDELKRRQDARNWDEMKELAKKIKDKNELARIRREAMQKHIKRAVEERQKLKDLLECRRSEVTAGHARLLQQIIADRKWEEECLQKLYETRCSAITSKHRSTLVSSSSNGGNPVSTEPTSTCSNPSTAFPVSIPPPSPPPVTSLPPPFPGTFPRVRAAAARIDPTVSERPASLDFPTQSRPLRSERHTPVSPTQSCGPSSPMRSPERPSSYGGCDLFGGGDDAENFRARHGKLQLMCRSETSLVDVESTWL